MSFFNGYRTFFFGLAVVLFGAFGKHVAPATFAQYWDVAVSLIGVSIIFMRMVTHGPMFARMATDVGISAANITEIKAMLAGLPDLGAFGPALDDLHAKVDALAPPPAASVDPAQPQAGTVAAAQPAGGTSIGATAAALLLAVVLGVGLTACQNPVIPPAPKTPAQAVYETKTLLVAAEDAALAYAGQVCPVAATCQDPRVAAIVKAMNNADSIVQLAETTVRTAPAGSITAGQAVADAQGALNTFKGVLTSYGVTLPPALAAFAAPSAGVAP